MELEAERRRAAELEAALQQAQNTATRQQELASAGAVQLQCDSAPLFALFCYS